MRIMLGTLYLITAVLAFGISDVHTLSDRNEAALEVWTYPLAAAYWTSRILIITVWFTLLPAFLIATKLKSHFSRALVMWVGIVVGMYPIWETTPLGAVTALVTLLICFGLASLLRSHSTIRSWRSFKRPTKQAP